MPLTCPVGFDTERLRTEIQNIYGRVAVDPDSDFHFHRGPRYAAEFLGYDPEKLAVLPTEVTASFAGVGNPHRIGPISAGETVLDIGCGAGTDLLLAAREVGPTGRAIGVDMTPSMIERARAGAKTLGLEHVEIRQGEAQALPVEDRSVDVVISNGVLNLTPDKTKAFGEIARILKPGGRLLLADIIIGTELSESARRDIDLWTG
ncbi:MAG TPA: methyltransferase domain-containing protein [Candidatus Eisenbacteria bacterium]|nr:methyltransferase domain-containing protein [Candidatus Eisenbacteria bacterium]